MVQFQCDYNEGAHPRILERMIQTNFEQTVGYGEDHFCEAARSLIKKACGREDADVHFLVGGTQANATVISAALKPYQGVICAHTGHINIHETGAIEHGGHKVLAVPSENGKLSAEGLLRTIELHYEEDGPEHTVQPGMVYISFSTETGTIYTLSELKAFRSICDRYGLPLFIDGARLGYGLASEGCDVTLQDIAAIADVFYIGGTKQRDDEQQFDQLPFQAALGSFWGWLLSRLLLFSAILRRLGRRRVPVALLGLLPGSVPLILLRRLGTITLIVHDGK